MDLLWRACVWTAWDADWCNDEAAWLHGCACSCTLLQLILIGDLFLSPLFPLQLLAPDEREKLPSLLFLGLFLSSPFSLVSMHVWTSNSFRVWCFHVLNLIMHVQVRKIFTMHVCISLFLNLLLKFTHVYALISVVLGPWFSQHKTIRLNHHTHKRDEYAHISTYVKWIWITSLIWSDPLSIIFYFILFLQVI